MHANFLAWDWNDICNGIIVIQDKEIVIDLWVKSLQKAFMNDLFLLTLQCLNQKIYVHNNKIMLNILMFN